MASEDSTIIIRAIDQASGIIAHIADALGGIGNASGTTTDALGRLHDAQGRYLAAAETSTSAAREDGEGIRQIGQRADEAREHVQSLGTVGQVALGGCSRTALNAPPGPFLILASKLSKPLPIKRK